MANRATRRAISGRSTEDKLNKLLDELRGVQGALANVSTAISVPTQDFGSSADPETAINRRMEALLGQLSQFPNELNQLNDKITGIRQESFRGSDAYGIVTVVLSDACSKMSISINADVAQHLEPGELERHIEEAHASAAAQFKEKQVATKSWIDSAVEPMQKLMDEANELEKDSRKLNGR